MFTLRADQQNLEDGLFRSWETGAKATILVAPTGFGKTVVMSNISRKLDRPAVAIAHRQELVGQISLAVAQSGVVHNIIAPDKVIRFCINQHIDQLGQSFYNERANFTVGGVDTMNARADALKQWANNIGYWMIDECHHVLEGNKWGRAVDMFPNAKGVGYTASPIRCDRKSLHVDQGGVFDDMCVGPTMRELIDAGNLCDYRIFGPPQSIDTSNLPISKATGDFSNPGLRVAAAKSTITGDVVEHYLKIAGGKRGITFAVDVDNAVKIATAFRDAGVPAEAVSAKTPDAVRTEVIRKFRRGSILQLVNVDLFGEGFDVPAVEVVSMARPTQSFGLYLQQFGRALRTLEGKKHGIVIDHVGNVKQHGLPDAVRKWDLRAEERGRRVIRDPDVMPVTTCVACFRAYEAVTAICPYCGFKAEPESRGEPQFVDGDLEEFSPGLLAALRGEIDRIDGPALVPQHLRETPAAVAIVRNHGERQVAQRQLREAIQWWAGIRRDQGQPDSEIYRRFFHTFGVDIATAQGLGAKDADELAGRITERYWV